MPWRAGQRLQGGKYVIERVLGQGGFGITYKGVHINLNRTVVIKTPNEYLSHYPEYDKYIKRFIQEGRILARLSQDPHPHIVGVIDLFEEGDTHCLVMNFVPGENLFEAVKRRGVLPEAEIVPCIRQIGEALTVVHETGLVHRDAHPGNIMLRKNGKAVLIDFGIAKEILPNTSKDDRANKGFAPYEQMVRGSREPTVDIYCLAATLYYAITGQRPTTSLARKIDDASLIPPKQIVPGISDQLNQAIIEGMALEAKDRPPSMQEWLKMLEVSKAIPSPPSETVHIQEVVPPKPKPESVVASLNEFKQMEARAVVSPKAKSEPSPSVEEVHGTEATPGKQVTHIWWLWLAGSWVGYVLMGYFLGTSYALLWAGTVAGAVILAWAWASFPGGKEVWFSGILAILWAVIMAVVWAGALVEALIDGTGALFVAMAGAFPAIIFESIFGYKLLRIYELQKSFSKFHIFIILAGISALGLISGLLGQLIFKT
ncbi:serine/threonine protein kinase [Nostoc sp.]|uniref:serine/threonine protein kinase n=1 Tax=Nostoc sp. TaxID=1180 RepID=UPI002FF833AD